MEKQKNQKQKQSGGFNPIGLCIGAGIGLCYGVALDNMGLGLCLGMGIGLCFSVAMGHKSDANDKQNQASGEE